MVKYVGEKNYQHGSKEKTGVLITNLGTPDAPTSKSLKQYLNEFLSDSRVNEKSYIYHRKNFYQINTIEKEINHGMNMTYDTHLHIQICIPKHVGNLNVNYECG